MPNTIDPHDVRPEVVLTLGAGHLGSTPTVSATLSLAWFPPETGAAQTIDHTTWWVPAAGLTLTQAQPVVSPAQAVRVPDAALLAQPATALSPSAPVSALLRGLSDTGPSGGAVSVIVGLPPMCRVYVDGQWRFVTDESGTLAVPAGHLLITDRLGRLLASGMVVTARRYLYGSEAALRSMESFVFEGPRLNLAAPFTLLRVSQSPGEYIEVERLKADSLVHAGGIWVQADNTGKVRVGPLAGGTYTVLVTDRDGFVYGSMDGAVPGDKLYGAFNFAGGYGYYGWFSGKGVEVRKAFIDVADELTVTDTGALKTVRQIFRLDTFTSDDAPRGRKGPARQLDTLLLSDLPALNPVKMTVRELFTAADRAWKHLTPTGRETLSVSDLPSVFNTRIRVYETLTVTDRSNRPASWMVLDLMYADDQPVMSRTKQTVYEFVSVADSGKTTYRHFVKRDLALLGELGSFKNLSKRGLDVFTALDEKVQSLLSLTAEDGVNVTDLGRVQLASLRTWDGALLLDRVGALTNANVRADDALSLTDRVAGAAPWRSRILERLALSERSVLGVQAGTPPVSTDPSLSVRGWARAALDRLTLTEEVLPELPPTPPDAPQVVERTFMERFTRRTDELRLVERGILVRELYAQDSFSLSEQGRFPQLATFSPDNLRFTPLGSMQQRPELRLSRAADGTLHAAYLREGGGLYHARSLPDGTWTGVTARLLSNTPLNARSPSVTEHGGSLYAAFAVPRGTWTDFTVLRDGQSFWTHSVPSPDMDIQLASTERYQGNFGELLIAYTHDPRTLRVRSGNAEQSYPYGEDIRLDHVAVANGAVNWVLAATGTPGKRSAFSAWPRQGQLVTDSQTTQLSLRGASLTPSNLRRAVGDSHEVRTTLRGAGLYHVSRGSGGTDALRPETRLRGVRLDSLYTRTAPTDATYVGLTLRGGALTRSALQTPVTDTPSLTLALRAARLQPTTRTATPDDLLGVTVQFHGGRLERK